MNGPPLPDLSIRQFEYLVAVADAPTWAVAASSVGVSPSALSQGLAELERRIGIQLFERVGRRRVLRPAATPVLLHARQVLGLTGDLAAWATTVRTGGRGRVRLGMIDAAAVVHFPDTLRRFRAEHPDVELHLTVAPSGQLMADLLAGQLDLLVCVAPAATPDGIAHEPLLREELVVYGPPGSPPGDPSGWGPWVLFPPTSHTRTTILDALRVLGAPVAVVAESNQPEVLREMVLLGMGWTVLPRSQAEQGDRPLTDGCSLVGRQLVVARRRGAVTDPALDVLAAALHTAADGDRAPGRYV